MRGGVGPSIRMAIPTLVEEQDDKTI